VLGVERVIVLPADTAIGNAGSSSASRQTWFTGGAVRDACDAVRDSILARARERLCESDGELRLDDGGLVDASGARLASLADLVGDEPVEETREYRPRRTSQLDENGQGDAHLAFCFAAHRAVVDVDTELGLVRVVEIATAQDVGRAVNPLSLEGQLEGGIAQGLGLALMEEIQLSDGRVRNPSFTDYLIPTILDMPPVRSRILELGEPNAPYGANGAAEAPTISSTPAIVAAIREACERPLARVPVRPDDIVGLA
jgi:CO/xanthine dehydrogenase Mo-binding subunit